MEDAGLATVYDHGAHAASFGAATDAYEAGRPPYPGAALDWLVPAGARTVVDLGAGTGKLTTDLVARDLEVIAVEPSEQLRQRLGQVVPAATALVGSAEEIPLADASVDAVVVAQAWHWVDPARAVPEIARVLRPGGRLALVWNIRQEQPGWTSALGELLRAGTEQVNDTSMGIGQIDVGAPFGPMERHEVAWSHRTTAAQVVEMVASRSYVITLPLERRAALLEQVRDLMATHPDLAGAQEIAMPYVSHCHRAQLA